MYLPCAFWARWEVSVRLARLPPESARMFPTSPISSASPSWLPSPCLSSSGSHLRCPGGSLRLWKAPPVAARRKGLASHQRAPPSFQQNLPGLELLFRLLENMTGFFAKLAWKSFALLMTSPVIPT